MTTAYKLVLDLLSAYGSPQSMWPIGGKCSLVFSESIYWHSIWIVKHDASCSSLQRQELRGDNIQEIAEKIFLAFKDGGWLESAMCGGKKIVVMLGDGTGKPEEFMMTCELLGMSIDKES